MKQISLNNLIDNVKGYNNIEGVENILGQFKMYLLGRCRKNSKAYNTIALLNTNHLKNLNTSSVNGRLVFMDDKVKYIAGQYEPVEIQELKKELIKAINKGI